MDVKFMEKNTGEKRFDNIKQDDVVILPAFGATIQELKELDEKYVNRI